MIANIFVIYIGAVGVAELGTTLDNPSRQRGNSSPQNSGNSPEETVPPVKKFWGSWF